MFLIVIIATARAVRPKLADTRTPQGRVVVVVRGDVQVVAEGMVLRVAGHIFVDLRLGVA